KHVRGSRRGKVAVRKSQVDGDPARLFLRQAIGVDACQGAHQRALAVVHVTGRGKNVWNHTHLHRQPSADRTAASTCPSWRVKIVRRSSLNRLPEIYPMTGSRPARSLAPKS